MLTHEAAIRLNRESAGTKIVSVYLDADENDPAERRAWRIRLNGMLRSASAELPKDEERAFRAAAEHIERELTVYDGHLPSRGWVAFASPDGLLHAGPTPTPMPDLVRWELGAHVAPWIRALKQSRPVTAVVADRRQARIVAYLEGELHEQVVIPAEEVELDVQQLSKRPATHTGVRGATGTDVAQRVEERTVRRLVRDVVEALAVPIREKHLLVIGGRAEAPREIERALPERARDYAIVAPGIDPDASDAVLKEAIEAAASALSSRLHEALVDEIIETTRAAGRACLGAQLTERALDAGAVDTLVVSRAFLRADPEAAERLIDRALEQGASVEQVGGTVGPRLDAEGGVGARLRFEV